MIKQKFGQALFLLGYVSKLFHEIRFTMCHNFSYVGHTAHRLCGNVLTFKLRILELPAQFRKAEVK